MSWIAGQSLGGYLNSFGDARYPSAVAVGLYAFDFALISLARRATRLQGPLLRNARLQPDTHYCISTARPSVPQRCA